MKIFKLYWLTGQESFVRGETVEKAFQNGGYGAGSLRALDFYKEIDELPNEMKSFEVIKENGKIQKLNNPSFIKQIKDHELKAGAEINITYASRIFRYNLMEITNHSFRFKEEVIDCY